VKPIKVDCTIIAATNRDLETLTKTRVFREDLFYRLNTFPLRIPPLRARREDILLLAQHYLSKYNQTYGMEKWISPAAFSTLHSYPFPGNVRELKNVIKNAVVMSEEDGMDEFIRKSLQRGAGPGKGIGVERKRQSLGGEMVAAEKEALKEALSRCKSTREMAKYLHISQPTIVRKLKKHKLSLPSIHK
jgi:transcriptional regulator with PAS, ATPase and Fis domain